MAILTDLRPLDLILVSPVLLYDLELRSGGRIEAVAPSGLRDLARSVLR